MRRKSNGTPGEALALSNCRMCTRTHAHLRCSLTPRLRRFQFHSAGPELFVIVHVSYTWSCTITVFGRAFMNFIARSRDEGLLYWRWRWERKQKPSMSTTFPCPSVFPYEYRDRARSYVIVHDHTQLCTITVFEWACAFMDLARSRDERLLTKEERENKKTSMSTITVVECAWTER
jgi:hypothetical protein